MSYLVRQDLAPSHWPKANAVPLHLLPHLSDDSESVSQRPENLEDDFEEAHFLTWLDCCFQQFGLFIAHTYTKLKKSKMEALQKEYKMYEAYRQKLEMYENFTRDVRKFDKLAMYNSSHTSVIQRLNPLEKEKGAVPEIKQKFGGLEKSLAEKTALIDRLELEKT